MLTDDSSDILRRSAAPRRYRSIFISDVHLGFRGCKADCLLDFLRHVESDYLYLVGDIVDGWRLKKTCVWPEPHKEIFRRLLARADEGTAVVYLPGNHDEELRSLLGRTFRGVRILHEVVHETADGRRLLVTHGDLFDGVVRDMRWLAVVGSVAYDLSLVLNNAVNAVRGRLGLGYWPLSAYLKRRVKAAVSFIDDFERSLVAEARRRAVCGVVCGHVHKPEMRTVGGVLYVNDGDWVESCSALVEHGDGRLELLHWAGERGLSPAPVPAAAAARPAVAAEGGGGRRPAVAA